MSKNPYKPINTESPLVKNLSESAKEYLREIYEKDEKLNSSDPDMFEVRPVGQDGATFQPQIKEARDDRPVIQVDVTKDEIAYNQQRCSKLFSSIFLELINSEKSLAEVSAEIQKALTNQGIEVNIDSLSGIMDMANERMLKIYMAKSLAHFYGMGREWDSILTKELELIYSPRRASPPDQQKSR